MLLGGLVVSTVFTLFLVPCLFILALETKSGLLRLLGMLEPADDFGSPSEILIPTAQLIEAAPTNVPLADDPGLDLTDYSSKHL